jgi:hypothetical protein
MGFGASIFTFALGAVLAFAVTASVEGIELETVGWILMAVGATGLLLSLAFWGGAPWRGERRTTVVERHDDLVP